VSSYALVAVGGAPRRVARGVQVSAGRRELLGPHPLRHRRDLRAHRQPEHGRRVPPARRCASAQAPGRRRARWPHGRLHGQGRALPPPPVAPGRACERPESGQRGALRHRGQARDRGDAARLPGVSRRRGRARGRAQRGARLAGRRVDPRRRRLCAASGGHQADPGLLDGVEHRLHRPRVSRSPPSAPSRERAFTCSITRSSRPRSSSPSAR
jgi:hypothetical protein